MVLLRYKPTAYKNLYQQGQKWVVSFASKNHTGESIKRLQRFPLKEKDKALKLVVQHWGSIAQALREGASDEYDPYERVNSQGSVRYEATEYRNMFRQGQAYVIKYKEGGKAVTKSFPLTDKEGAIRFLVKNRGYKSRKAALRPAAQQDTESPVRVVVGNATQGRRCQQAQVIGIHALKALRQAMVEPDNARQELRWISKDLLRGVRLVDQHMTPKEMRLLLALQGSASIKITDATYSTLRSIASAWV
jgi:hypothetical protein